MRFFSELTKNISQKRREQIERQKELIRHRFSDGKLYKLTCDGWVEVQPRVDLQRLDKPDPQVNQTYTENNVYS